MEQPRRSLYPHQLGGGGHFGVGPGGSAMAQPSAQLASLQSCVASVSLSCQTLEDSIATLEEGTRDFPRLATVLNNKRHFDLVTERDIRLARDRLATEIAPQLRELIARAEAALERDERRSRALRNKASQQAARLEQLASISASPSELGSKKPSITVTASAESSPAERERARARLEELRKTRERLSNEVAEMEEKVRMMETESRLLQKSNTTARMAR